MIPSLEPFLQAFAADLRCGDRTTELLGLGERGVTAELRARTPLVVACGALVEALPRALGLDWRVSELVADGRELPAGGLLGRIHAPAGELLALERTLLNALAHLCGVATETRRWLRALPAGYRLLDTRKTLPGLGAWEKLAFRVGGGVNHRQGLDEVVMIKDNHRALVPDLWTRLAELADRVPPGTRIVVEVESLDEALQAVRTAPVDLLVDNEPPDRWPAYWERLPAHVQLEFSGGIGYEDLAELPPPPRPVWLSASAPILAAPPADVGLDVVDA